MISIEDILLELSLKYLPLLLYVLVMHFRSLAEFWHWFVANVPGNSVGEGEEIFQLLHPLVLPEGNGGHRYYSNHTLEVFLS